MQVKPQRAVHASVGRGGEFTSTGIGYDDYVRMGTQEHKLNAGRHGDTPAWAFSDTKLRDVLVRLMEARAYNGRTGSKYPTHGTPAERLERAQKMLNDVRRPVLMATLGKLCAAYVAAKNARDTARVEALGRKIEEADTQLIMINDAAKTIAGVAYHYWRCGLSSVDTAHALHIKPPHVRRIVWQLNKAAGQLGYGPATKATTHRPGTVAKRLAEKRARTPVQRAPVQRTPVQREQRNRLEREARKQRAGWSAEHRAKVDTIWARWRVERGFAEDKEEGRKQVRVARERRRKPRAHRAKARELPEALRQAAYLTLTRTKDPALHCQAAITLVRHLAPMTATALGVG
jgi:hypothetical protein